MEEVYGETDLYGEVDYPEVMGPCCLIVGIMEEVCSSRSLQYNKTNSPSQVVY